MLDCITWSIGLMVPTDNSQVLRVEISTRGLPERERIPHWNGKSHVADIEPLSDKPFEAEATLCLLPGLRVGWWRSERRARWRRTFERMQDGDDDFSLLLPLDGPLVSRETLVGPGEGIGLLHAEPFTVSFRGRHEHLILMLPQTGLRPAISNLEDAANRLVPRGNEALRLLRHYVGGLKDIAAVVDAALCKKVVQHVYDLVAIAMGAKAERLADRGGIRAARLKAIKNDFAAHPSMNLAALAARQGVTPRYVQKLFEEDGTTFTVYALEQRLERARRLLADPNNATAAIAALAYEAGFGDLSNFNRAFKSRFGLTPSDLRAQASKDR